MRLTAVILAKNEEKGIAECVKSVAFCDETIVVDDGSTDRTAEVAERSGAKVYAHTLDDDFSKQRNFGLQKARGEWVLFIDADEVVGDKLRAEILEVINRSDGTSGYRLRREYDFLGRVIKYGELRSARILRLAKRESGIWVRRVHEYWDVRGRIGNLKSPLYHSPRMDVSGFVMKLNRWSDIHAAENLREGKKVTLVKIIFYPPVKFIRSYFFNFGFLEGVQGFLLAAFMSLHSFLAWSKQWEMQQRKK
jgi:glycosyltransferase involved in cell wall biosynthesis